MAEPLVVIYQRLSYEWGREGLSAALVARRRALPKSYPLSLAPLPAGVVAVAQNVEWTDEDGFTTPLETIHQYGQLSDLQPTEVEVTPGLDAESWQLAPLPLTGLSGSLKLGVGQLARFEWNEHLGADQTGDRRVRHTIISVTLSPRTVNRDLFSKMPDLYYSHFIDLNQRRLKAGGIQ